MILIYKISCPFIEIFWHNNSVSNTIYTIAFSENYIQVRNINHVMTLNDLSIMCLSIERNVLGRFETDATDMAFR